MDMRFSYDEEISYYLAFETRSVTPLHLSTTRGLTY